MTKPIQIFTLNELLSDNQSPHPSTNMPSCNFDSHPDYSNNNHKENHNIDNTKTSPIKNKKTAIKTPKKEIAKKPIDTKTEQLPDTLRHIHETAELQSPYDNLDKQTRYMRWLAFYYLSKKELSQTQLRKKLLEKDCNELAVNELIEEFANKGYQSDERCATMIVRENIRKGRGKLQIKQALKLAHLNYADDELNVLIEKSGISLLDDTILENDPNAHSHSQHSQLTYQDWLKLAIEARIKKYGTQLPKTPNEKAKQLRFLQYRGFEMDICFDALKMTLDDLME